ncbi:DUF4391 domain-containing protein [Limnohabitans sp.]|uniref:DUF4391 domain-containing protein n=1 Tax=Limnohabitans sp. TaxID=1907725 RepID=UPI00333EDAE4
MNANDLFAALSLPPSAWVQQRVPKKLLTEHSAITASDRKLIQDQVQEVQWLAAIKPSNAGVPTFEDAQRSYLELAVISISLRQATTSQMQRVAELLHRAVPYPVLLILDAGDTLAMSMAHIRWAQQEADKTVLDGDVLMATLLTHESASAAHNGFMAALPLQQQTRTHLHALVQSWMDTLSAWQAVAIMGQFVPSPSSEVAAQRREALRQCQALDVKISQLRAQASKEKQMGRLVEINGMINSCKAQRLNAEFVLKNNAFLQLEKLS